MKDSEKKNKTNNINDNIIIYLPRELNGFVKIYETDNFWKWINPKYVKQRVKDLQFAIVPPGHFRERLVEMIEEKVSHEILSIFIKNYIHTEQEFIINELNKYIELHEQYFKKQQ